MFLSILLLISFYFLMWQRDYRKRLNSGEDWIWFLSLINSDDLLLLWGKIVFKKYKQSSDFINSTIQKTYHLSYNNCTFISPINTFPWRETWIFTRQIKVQIGKSTLIILFIKEKMPTLAGNKHPSIHFFLHGPRLFHLSTEKVRVRSIGNGHQSGFSRADRINNNINK